MEKLTRNELFSLEQYDEKRLDFRRQVMAHKNHRRVFLGEHLSLLFEDRLTIQYQVQEMLRIERIYKASAIEEELEAYNPLIPDGSNWKAVLLIQYEKEERPEALQKLIGVERKIWVKVEGSDKVYPIADEDLERENDEKTSAVHFLRFEFSNEMISAIKNNRVVTMGVDHPAYQIESYPIPAEVLKALSNDFAA